VHNQGPAWAPAVPLTLVILALVVVQVVTTIRARAIKRDLDELNRLMPG